MYVCLEIYIKHAGEFNNSYITKWRQKERCFLFEIKEGKGKTIYSSWESLFSTISPCPPSTNYEPRSQCLLLSIGPPLHWLCDSLLTGIWQKWALTWVSQNSPLSCFSQPNHQAVYIACKWMPNSLHWTPGQYPASTASHLYEPAQKFHSSLTPRYYQQQTSCGAEEQPSRAQWITEL